MPTKKEDPRMIAQYFNLLINYRKKYGKVMLFFQCGSFYEIYGLYEPGTKKSNEEFNDSNKLNKILDCHVAYKTTTKYKGFYITMAGYPLSCPLAKNVPTVIEEGWTVVVWKQSEQNKQERYEYRIFSTGTSWFNDTNKLSNCFTICWLEHYKSDVESSMPYLYCGLANIDIFTGKSNLYQFKYSNNKLHNINAYEDIDRFNSIHNPREIIFIHNLENSNYVTDIIQWSGICTKKIHIFSLINENEYSKEINNCQKQVYIKDVFRNFFPKYDFFQLMKSTALEEYPYAQYAYSFLLNFVKECNCLLTKNLYVPTVETINDKLLLATHSLKQLNIINVDKQKNTTSSVVNLINKTCTNMGKRQFYQQITHPSSDIKFLNKEYDMIEYVLNNKQFIDLRENLGFIKDIEKLYRKTIHFTAKPYEICNFYNNLNNIEKMKELLEKDDTFKKYIDSKCNIEKLTRSIIELKDYFESQLNFSLCQELDEVGRDSNFFKRGLYSSLDKYEKEYIESCQELDVIRKELTNLAIKAKATTSKSIENDSVIVVHTTDKSGLFLKITNARATKMKKFGYGETLGFCEKKEQTWISNYDKSVKTTNINLKIDFKSVSGVESSAKRIFNKQLNDLYDSILRSSTNLNEELANRFKDFLKKTNTYFREIDQVIEFVTLIDILLTKAYISEKYNYCKPLIRETVRSFFKATELRHPLVEHINTNEIYTANDVSLGLDKTGMLVYGTNAVGKTTLIRAIGCNIVMAQAGMFVPSTTFIFNPYKSVFTRILGNDNIFKCLSTFAVEMTELELITNNCNKNSLILGDELCSGTEIGSAYSIFTQSLLWFNNTESSHIFATHFHEISKLEDITSLKELDICHMSVRYDGDLLIYDRKLKEGPGNNSYGLEVLKSFNMPMAFMKGAFKIRNKIEGKNDISLKKKKTKYNSKKLKSDCEFCNSKGIDVHHLTPQHFADKNGFITYFNKNHSANLANVCDKCHSSFTIKGIIHTKKKTIGGKTAYSFVET